MLKFLYAYPEIISFTVNITTAIVFAVKGQEGKFYYWLGATILTLGLLKQRG